MLKKFKVITKIIEWVTFVFLLGILGIIFSPNLPINNIPKTFVVVTGSMEPTIKTGSVVFVKSVDPTTIKKGDIIAFTSPNNSKDTILHRVDSIKSTNPLRFSTKGDANNAPDAWDVMDVGIKGVYFGAIPYLGHIGAFVKKPLGFGIVVGLPALLFIISQLLNIKKAITEEVDRKVAQTLESKKKSKPTDVSIKSLTIFITLFSALVGLSTLKVINASFSDTVAVSGITLSVKDFVPPPVPTLISPINNIVRTTDDLTMDWSDVSDFQNINSVYYIYQSAYDEFFTSIAYTSSHLNNSFIFAPGTPDGSYYWRVKACDTADNCSYWSAPWELTIDSTLPDSVITSPHNSDHDNDIKYIYFWDGKIKGTASDTLSGVDHVEISIQRMFLDLFWDGTKWVSDPHVRVSVGVSGPSNQWTYDFKNRPPFGIFKIVSHAVDKAGNIENSAIIEFENLETLPMSFDLDINKNTSKIFLNINHIQTTPLDYEILYQNSVGEQGIAGKILPDQVINGQVSKEFYLGTCSSGGVCTPDAITIGSTITVSLGEDTKSYNY